MNFKMINKKPKMKKCKNGEEAKNMEIESINFGDTMEDFLEK